MRACLLWLLLLAPLAEAKKIPLKDVELGPDGEFISCTLRDGRVFLATSWIVILENEILAKKTPSAELTPTAEVLTYRGPHYFVKAHRQFCGREGYMGASIRYQLKGKIRTDQVQCVERHACAHQK